MPNYYRGKKAGRGRGWLKRNMGRAGSALKKRYTSGGKLSLAKIASDAKYALSIAKTARGLLNTEKKRYEINNYNQTMAQVNANASGHWTYEITPSVSQGTGFGSRQGSSISVRSMFFRFQLAQQSAASAPTTVRLYVIQTRNGDAFDVTQFLNYNKYLGALNGVNIYDTHCSRDPDFFSNFRVLRSKQIRLQPDQLSSQSIVKDVTLKLNFGRNGKHVRLNDNTNTPTNTRFYLLALADCGNCNVSTASTLAGIPINAISTGVSMNMDGTVYFIDN